jgi:antitoxin (DNA-binding transcriptional repressor) of toxin-antitoxin stability system
MHPEIGSYEAKTHLPKLLREIGKGRAYTITLHGRPVADLVPSAAAGRVDRQAAIAAMRALPKLRVPTGQSVRAWINEGRK